MIFSVCVMCCSQDVSGDHLLLWLFDILAVEDFFSNAISLHVCLWTFSWWNQNETGLPSSGRPPHLQQLRVLGQLCQDHHDLCRRRSSVRRQWECAGMNDMIIFNIQFKNWFPKFMQSSQIMDTQGYIWLIWIHSVASWGKSDELFQSSLSPIINCWCLQNTKYYLHMLHVIFTLLLFPWFTYLLDSGLFRASSLIR